jgi:hypothetical protein
MNNDPLGKNSSNRKNIKFKFFQKINFWYRSMSKKANFESSTIRNYSMYVCMRLFVIISSFRTVK